MERKHRNQVKTQFGKRLAALRKEKKLSYRELSYRCDVDHSDIKKFEKGERNLQLTTIVELATGLDVEPKELLNFDCDFLKK